MHTKLCTSSRIAPVGGRRPSPSVHAVSRCVCLNTLKYSLCLGRLSWLSLITPVKSMETFMEDSGIHDKILAALTATVVAVTPLPAAAEITPVYFGNGCFWGRQKDFIDTETKLGRTPQQFTGVVGYAGGKVNNGSTCYYYNSPESVYEKQGHAEVVQVGLQTEEAQQQFGAFAETYFAQFRKSKAGMIRQDPQDQGPGYRNVVGIPGGVDSPFFDILKAKNKDNMKLVRGEGNAFENGKPTEDDAVNIIYVLDSTALPFHQAEVYHQFHDGLGKKFPTAYTKDLKTTKLKDGTIGSQQGCLEYPF